MEKKIPKNIRQIGNVSDNPKIYVEDYVDIYFEQLREKVQEGPVGAFLIGEILRQDEQEFVFVNGAVQIQDLTMEGKEVVIGEKAWKKGCEECKHFFEGKIILGWFLIAPDLPLQLNYNLLKIHEKLFAKKGRLFIQMDKEEKEESYYMYKYNDLMQISGHYIYYEKNADMQDYMIAKRRDNGVTPSEVYEDAAAKSFRSTIKEKGGKKKKTKNTLSFSYAISALVLIAVVAIGITYLNDYGDMKVISSAITDVIGGGFGQAEDEMEEKEAGNTTQVDVVVTDQEDKEEVGVEGYVGIDEQESEVEHQIEVEGQVAQGDELVEIESEEEVVVEEQETYVVKKDDTLVKISRTIYGDASHVDELCEINHLDVKDYIHVGQELLLP